MVRPSSNRWVFSAGSASFGFFGLARVTHFAGQRSVSNLIQLCIGVFYANRYSWWFATGQFSYVLPQRGKILHGVNAALAGAARAHNQTFNADSLQRGILLRKILRPAANHSAGMPAPFCRLTWRYASSISKDGPNLKVVCVPREFFHARW